MDARMQSANGDGHKSTPRHKGGGWITLPFIMLTMAGTSLAAGGWISNLIVFLIEEFNIKSISAAKIFNVVNGCTLVFPIVGAIIADSFLGCFSIVWISTLISLLGTVLLVLTAAVKSLRPPESKNPTELQFAVLYLGLALASLGLAGTRYTIGSMGANQFDKPKHQDIFFNWYIFTMYMSTVISSTAIVYVQDNLSWSWGFGICIAANVLGLAIFLAGSRFYRDLKPQGSPFVGLGRVIVAAARRRKLLLSQNGEDYNQGQHDAEKKPIALPTTFFRFLNCAALKSEGDTEPGGSIRKWELCTVQEVEDFKNLIKLVPLWLSGLFLVIPLVVQLSLAVLQALTMDRHLGPHFKFPAGSVQVFILTGTALAVIFIDRLVFPLWEKFMTRCPMTPLRRVGIGHLLTILSMAITALVEAKRLRTAREHQLQDLDTAVVPMSVFWLVPPLAIAGIGEAFHFPGNVALFYQEFPAALKSTSTAVVAMFIGISFYVGNAVIDLFRRTTDWLPDNINQGRLDYVYWACCIIGTLNFGYFLVCASSYKHQNGVKVTEDYAS